MTRPLVLIDDDDDLRDTLSGILQTSGYEVTAFADAREALVELRRGLSPSLILLDLMMPGMSGWEFRAAQLRDESLARIPVVVVTAAHTLRDEAGTLDGVESLRKPFSLDAILEVVGRYAV